MNEPDAAADPTSDRLSRLRDLVPEAFADGEIDVTRLLGAVGDPPVSAGGYGLSWPGKTDAIALLTQGAAGALVPADLEGDDSAPRHAIVVGENLDVLRCMYHAYFEAVDCIYIDPPYNTGKDRIYADTFRSGTGEFLQASGQVAENGARLVANAKTNGRFHSRWLTMIYPRLFIAHKLLRRDGVIIVSVDDNEVHNLRHVLNEVFGEENFIAQLVWEKTRKNDDSLFSVGHEYLLVYAKSRSTLRDIGTVWREPKEGAAEMWVRYLELRDEHDGDIAEIQVAFRTWLSDLPQEHPSRKLARYKHIDANGPWRDRDISWPGGGGARYDVMHPTTGEPVAVPPGGWRFSKPEEMQRQIALGLVEFREDDSEPPFRKIHLKPIAPELDADPVDTDELESDDDYDAPDIGMQVMGSVIYRQAQVAVKHLKKLFDGQKLFDNPKDHEILRRLLRYVLNGRSQPLILDFFAGSGSTAEAVLESNAQTGTDWRFVLAQLPEATPAKSAARKAGYDTIDELTLERVARVQARLTGADASHKPEAIRILGFDADPVTVPAPASVEELVDQLQMRTAAAVDQETLMRGIFKHAQAHGVSLTARIQRDEVADGELLTIADPDGRTVRAWLGIEVPENLCELIGAAVNDVVIVRESALSDTAAANLVGRCVLRTA